MRELPQHLNRLISDGFWPKDASMQNAQYDQCIVEKQRLSEFLDHESETLILYRPPFSTAKEWQQDGMDFIPKIINTQLEFASDRLIVLGDFGMGSDSFLGLYYQNNTDDSHLILREKWGEKGEKLGWSVLSNSFNDFCIKLKILR